MHNSREIISKIDNLIAYAKSKGKDEAKLNALVAPLKAAVTQFYRLDFKDAFEFCISSLTHAGIRSGIVYEDYDPPKGDNKPAGYDDVTILFRCMDDLMNATGDEFNASIFETFDETGINQIYDSSLVNKWITDWSSMGGNILNQLDGVAEFANGYALGNSVRMILQAPKILSVPKVTDIAEDIYKGKKYSEAIEALGIDVYIPPALR